MPEAEPIEIEQPLAGNRTAVEFMEWLTWRFNRLRCMSVAEVAHRLLRTVTTRAERYGLFGSAPVEGADLTRAPVCWVHVPAGINGTPYIAAAERVVAGKFDVFALHDIDLGSPPRWNRDPSSGIEAPLSFGMLLDYRDPQQVGDIKYLWEPNRHLHLVTLAQAYALSGETRYFDVIMQHLESWFVSCPYRKGPNWSSALEAGIRLINWSVAWQLLGGSKSPLFENARAMRLRQRWLEAIYQHAQFVHNHFSLYSSANNHLIGEAAGLFIAAVTWAHWPKSEVWRVAAQDKLEREIVLQNAADGVNREQAVSYQQFELDLLLLPLLAAEANNLKFSDQYRSTIEAMLEYLASIMDACGNVPMIGDADDGAVVRLAQGGDFCRYRSSLATGAILFQRGDFKAKAKQLDDKTRWLIGAQVRSRFDALAASRQQLPVRRVFAEGGYYILGCEFETENEIRLVADAGPLGYQSIAAHGHADALAFTLSVAGMEFMVDPGTYAYHTQGQWRRYFRGTAAHNTLRVDGKDQSEQGGNFMWLRKAVAACSHWHTSPQEDVFEGWHDGYQRLDDPVLHRRKITFDKPARRVVIEDTLQMAGEHDIEIFFHCSELCRVDPIAEGYALSREGKTIVLRLPCQQGFTASVYYGSNAPISGWISRRFDEKQPAPTISWRGHLAGNVTFRSEILC